VEVLETLQLQSRLKVTLVVLGFTTARRLTVEAEVAQELQAQTLMVHLVLGGLIHKDMQAAAAAAQGVEPQVLVVLVGVELARLQGARMRQRTLVAAEEGAALRLLLMVAATAALES
jgi:hypothetical protein